MRRRPSEQSACASAEQRARFPPRELAIHIFFHAGSEVTRDLYWRAARGPFAALRVPLKHGKPANANAPAYAGVHAHSAGLNLPAHVDPGCTTRTTPTGTAGAVEDS